MSTWVSARPYDNATLQVAIAATPRPQDAGAVAQARQPIAWQPETARRIREILANDALLTQNLDKEFGAYYGIVDDKANTQALVISSVRRLLDADDEGGRWLRGVPYHGLIGYDSKPADALRASPKQAGSIEPTGLIAQWNGKEHVCGYCHGMVWAVGQAACNFPDGRPFDLGLGRNTHKLSSCFGCSTYLHANGWAPNAMHLGRSEWWVPLPEAEDALAAFNIGLGQPHEHQRIVTALNVSWERKITQWLRDGATLIVQRGVNAGFTPAVVDTASALLQVLPKRHDPRAVANLFLDALTVHDKDLLRLSRLVVQAPKPVH
ncbi:MAG: hypothetical protein GAK31_02720 [Stenotrophomonas maltophilia]|uniref:Uncharacterized protein n=1 Tax=Stenotrophomonas maltophilia TaxID=40324 RepID=A0A7V8JLT8_STEMA|nr:MAG: hypothetical protein GAK31_02720 [Stenotrophomonas maltophilia]